MLGMHVLYGGSVLRDWHQLSGPKKVLRQKALRLVTWAPGRDGPWRKGPSIQRK